MFVSLLKYSSKFTVPVKSSTVSRRFASTWKKVDPPKPTGTSAQNTNTNTTASSSSSNPASGGSFFKSIFGNDQSAAAVTPSKVASSSPKVASSSPNSFGSNPVSGGGDDKPLTTEQELESVKNKLNFTDVGPRYAWLLYSGFKEEKVLDSLEGEIEKIAKLFETSKTFQEVLNEDSLVSNKQRRQTMIDLFPTAKFSPIMEAFLVILGENNRLVDLPAIIEALQVIQKRIEGGVSVAKVIASQTLDPEEVAEIQEILKETFPESSNGEVDLDVQVDPSLGGGYEIFYEDSFHLDNSQRTQVDELMHLIDTSMNSSVSKESDIQAQDLAISRATKQA